MTDTTVTPATTSTTGHDDAERLGEQLGMTLAGIVILNMRAAQRGWERGYCYEHAAAYPATYGTSDPDAVPEEFTRMPVHTKTYRDQFAEGRADYRADNNLPPLPTT